MMASGPITSLQIDGGTVETVRDYFGGGEGLQNSAAGEEYSRNVGDPGLIPGLGRSPGEGNGYPLQDSGLGNSMDCIVHGVEKSQT